MVTINEMGIKVVIFQPCIDQYFCSFDPIYYYYYYTYFFQHS